MKKIFCLFLSFCMIYTVAYAEVAVNTKEETVLSESKLGAACADKFAELISADTSSSETIDIKEYKVKLALMNAEATDGRAALFAVSYYTGTTIPTYTSITGRSLLDTGYSSDNTYVFCHYKLDVDELFNYAEYLIAYYGWSYVTDTTSDDESYATIYLANGTKLISISAHFTLGMTIIGFERPVTVMPTSVYLNASSRTMIVGNTYTLEASVLPSNASDTDVTWSSSNSSVASVSSKGKVTAKAAGSATITAKTSNGKKATCSITVKNLVLKYYEGTTIPTFTCITGKSLAQTYVTDDGTVMYIYDLDIESHVDYEIYLMKNGWELLGENENDEEYTITAVYQKKDVVVVVIVDAMYQETIIFELDMSASTSTVKSGNKFIVTPQNVPEGSCIAFACYTDDALTDIQLKTYYNEDTLSFIATQAYDEVKIFVWESMYSMNPLCNAENVRL